MRTDFLDFPTAWAIQQDVGADLEHHPECSAVRMSALLCDCHAIPDEWERRAAIIRAHQEKT